jgi:hypothetical protein
MSYIYIYIYIYIWLKCMLFEVLGEKKNYPLASILKSKMKGYVDSINVACYYVCMAYH